MLVSDEELQILIEKIALDYNWDLNAYKTPTLKRRIKARMSKTGVKTPEDYLELISDNEEEYKKLINSLTVHYTSWFRDETAWEWILKIMKEKIADNEQVRIWSAGCSTGEEAYSLAILANELSKKSKSDSMMSNFVIYASDVDEEAVEISKKGLYDVNFVDIDESEIDKYFEKVDGMLQIKEKIKNLVKFSIADLAKDDYPVDLDLILCRNVMIYFNKDLQVDIFKNFYYSLAEGGYLVTGKTEVMPLNVSHLFNIESVGDHIFSKV